MGKPILLSGFMATGKSRVGRLVAERLGAKFEDLDSLVEARLGTPIARYFAEHGEVAFRSVEAEVLDELLARSGAIRLVVGLGGGALLNRERRVRLLGEAIVVSLSARPEVILGRAKADTGGIDKRPLLASGDPNEKILALLAERSAGYSECHGKVDTSDATPEEVCEKVLAIVERGGVALAAGASSYVVEIGGAGSGGAFARERLPRLLGGASGLLLVSDETVLPLHGAPTNEALRGAKVPLVSAILTPGEEHKNLGGLERIYEAAFEGGLDRKATFVGLGGGVVTDMTGFAAATWVRGVRWLGLPTTLLSMVDASVGGKTAVDFKAAKNSVGAFWQPSGVICDVATLATETDRAFLGALSEVVKTALIGDPVLFELLEDSADRIVARDPALLTQIIERSVTLKARVVALDEREQSIRAWLNLGHTYGHALESSGGYSALTHGEAIGLGLVCALRLGERFGHTSPTLTERVVRLLKRLGHDLRLGEKQLEAASGLLGLDKKKAGGAIRFVFAREVGEVFTENVALDELVRRATTLADPS